MADETLYGSASGFIQFDIEERPYNDGVIRDATIRSLSSGDLLRISFFPDFKDVEFDRGDFIAVDGKINIRDVEGDDGETRTYVNMTARRVFVGDTFGAAAPEVVKKKAASGGSKRKTF